MVDQKGQLHVQVCYALPEKQVFQEISVPAGTSLQQAIMLSGILQSNPEIDLTLSRVGVFGKLKTLEAVVQDRDRVEIYRPLIADPKESRRKRAEKKAYSKVR